MGISVRILTTAILGIVALASAGTVAGGEPEPAPFVIEFDERLDFLLDDWGGVDGRVGLTTCGELAYPTDERVLVVGGPGTPPECNQAWRVVTLVPRERHGALWNNVVLKPGETIRISTLMPFPAVDGPNLPPFWVELQDTDATPIGDIRALGSLTAYIDGIWCGSESLIVEDEDAFAVPVGAAGTPERCRELGGEIVLVDAGGRQLAVRPTVVGVGLFYWLQDLTLDPLGRGVPAPGSAGNLGRAPDHAMPLPLWLLMTGAIALLARRLTSPRRI